jgi:hypothetical protein
MNRSCAVLSHSPTDKIKMILTVFSISLHLKRYEEERQAKANQVLLRLTRKKGPGSVVPDHHLESGKQKEARELQSIR